MNTTTRKNIISTIVTVLLLILGIGLFSKLSSSKKSTLDAKIPKNERRIVEFKTFESTQAENSIELDGRLQAHQRINVTSKVQGLMLPSSKNVKVGRYFKKGELLFSIDNREAEYNLKSAKSSLLTAITQMMPDIKFDYPQAFENWQNYLLEFNIDKPINPFPQATSNQEKYFIAGKNIQSQYFQIKSQETRLSDYNIYAPFSGVVTSVNVFPGALISPNQTLCSFINTGLFELTAPVPLNSLEYISAGQEVSIVSDEMNKSWTGQVSRIGTQIDQNTQNLPIYITVKGKGLKDAMYVKGFIKGKSLSEIIELPKNIFLSPNELFVIEDSTLVRKTIQPIKRNENSILIRGLRSNEKVVTGSLAGLFAGQKVTY